MAHMQKNLVSPLVWRDKLYNSLAVEEPAAMSDLLLKYAPSSAMELIDFVVAEFGRPAFYHDSSSPDSWLGAQGRIQNSLKGTQSNNPQKLPDERGAGTHLLPNQLRREKGQ